jgi:aryl-alcohol dehydrogenase-like predicted oxidoreductase
MKFGYRDRTTNMGDLTGASLKIVSNCGQPSNNRTSVSGASQVTQSRRLGPFSVSAVGFGAMPLAGPNAFGPPADWDDAIALLRTVVESGANHVDTAQYYGPIVVNELIREALYPYPPELVIVSKVGAGRGNTPAQACLAWELAMAPNLLLIPGSSSMQHLQENLAAADVQLDATAFEAISWL